MQRHMVLCLISIQSILLLLLCFKRPLLQLSVPISFHNCKIYKSKIQQEKNQTRMKYKKKKKKTNHTNQHTPKPTHHQTPTNNQNNQPNSYSSASKHHNSSNHSQSASI